MAAADVDIIHLPAPPHRAGFTLIELLVVITIILGLMGLLVMMLPQVSFRSKMLKTDKIMGDAASALIRCGVEEGSSALALQRRAALGGVLTFRRQSGTALPEPEEGAWQDLSLRYRFGFPWGSEDRIGSGDPDIISVVRDGVTMRVSPTTLVDLSPLATIRLLEIAGVLPTDDPATPAIDESAVAWGQRSSDKPWNDAWGNPLVVGWGLYQPNSGPKVADALHAYGYSRAVYFAVAAVGPVAPTLTGVVTTDETALWDQANRLCQPTPETTWMERGWAIPPWSGIKLGKGEGADKGRFGLLTVPEDLR